jgi:hypothetical protein
MDWMNKALGGGTSEQHAGPSSPDQQAQHSLAAGSGPGSSSRLVSLRGKAAKAKTRPSLLNKDRCAGAAFRGRKGSTIDTATASSGRACKRAGAACASARQ